MLGMVSTDLHGDSHMGPLVAPSVLEKVGIDRFGCDQPTYKIASPADHFELPYMTHKFNGFLHKGHNVVPTVQSNHIGANLTDPM